MPTKTINFSSKFRKLKHLVEKYNVYFLFLCQKIPNTRKMKKKFTILWLTAILASLSCIAEGKEYHYYFTKYTTMEGLPSNTVYSVVQDKFGFVWVNTRDGIARFDGENFKKIELDEYDSIIQTSTTMCLDEDGLIWFCAKNRVGCYYPMDNKVEYIREFEANLISTIASDGKGGIWFLADDLTRYDKKTKTTKIFPKEEYPIPIKILTDSFGTLWILGINGCLYMYDIRDESFELISTPILKMVEPAIEGKLVACTIQNDIVLIDSHTFESEVILDSEKVEPYRNVLCFTERVEGEYWIGTEGGILVFDRNTGSLSHIAESSEDKHAISANNLMGLSTDRNGNIWAGTYYNGLNLWQDKKKAFQMYYDHLDDNSLKGNNIRPIKADSKGNIWIGTEDGEINKLDPKTNNMVNYETGGLFFDIQDILPVRNDIWVASYGNGVYRYNPDERVITSKVSIPQGYVLRLFQTAQNEILAGTVAGLYRYNYSTDSFQMVNSVSPHFIHAIYQDHIGNIWLGTMGGGLRVIDKDYQIVAKINPSEENGFVARHAVSIFEDSKNRIWVATEGDGIFYTDPDPNLQDIKFKNISKKDGLLSNVTCSITEDRDGFIWISTTQGVTLFNPETSTLIPSFFDKSQINGGQYSFDSRYIAQNGTIYLGTTDGMLSFSPAIIKGIVQDSRLLITDIKATTARKTTYFDIRGLDALSSTRLRVKSKNISTLEINYAIPDYLGALNAVFEYSLTGKRKDKGHYSQPVQTSKNSVAYTNITPGLYKFTIRMVGCDWDGTTKNIVLRVTPPFFKSIIANLFYIIFLLSLAAFFVRYISNKKENEKKMSLGQLEIQKQKEIYDAKIKYFTNITHEIRTPLSLIKMPVDKILSTEGYKSGSYDDMMTIKANTDRLLELTNQLLDLRKVEQKELKLIFTEEDIKDLLLSTCDYFIVGAKERHIALTIKVPDAPVYASCAAESIKKIITNLMSNAIKYGKDIIDVTLTEDNPAGTVSVRVDSNGVRISEDDRTRIFEPFYQARVSDDLMQGSNGTGLGLPFAKSLAELHNGRLYLDESVTDMNSFVLEIPKVQANAVSLKGEQDLIENVVQDIDSSKHTILIVEDSPEMRVYIGKELSEEYNTLLTGNGEEALDAIRNQKVDLVVSDIMMPVMDGCELCNRIKTDLDYCHIPVILLTAAVGVETRIETLEVGADGYIEKPFSIDLLKANISNIFKNKEISFRQFTQSPLSHYNSVVVNGMDDDFMEKLHSEVMNHLSEQDLNIEALTSILGTSKSTLYRKIKANTGLNINEYIRLCRLKEAAEMLSSQKYRINEVAYLVGFSSPSYFTTSFQKQFNISPSAFVKRIKQED